MSSGKTIFLKQVKSIPFLIEKGTSSIAQFFEGTSTITIKKQITSIAYLLGCQILEKIDPELLDLFPDRHPAHTQDPGCFGAITTSLAKRSDQGRFFH